jgi:hypothetical protein
MMIPSCSRSKENSIVVLMIKVDRRVHVNVREQLSNIILDDIFIWVSDTLLTIITGKLSIEIKQSNSAGQSKH